MQETEYLYIQNPNSLLYIPSRIFFPNLAIQTHLNEGTNVGQYGAATSNPIFLSLLELSSKYGG